MSGNLCTVVVLKLRPSELFTWSIGEMKNAYKFLLGNPEGKRSLGRPRRIREDNIKTDLRDVGWEDVD